MVTMCYMPNVGRKKWLARGIDIRYRKNIFKRSFRSGQNDLLRGILWLFLGLIIINLELSFDWPWCPLALSLGHKGKSITDLFS